LLGVWVVYDAKLIVIDLRMIDLCFSIEIGKNSKQNGTEHKKYAA